MTTEVLGSTANTTQPWIPDDSTFGARLALIRQRMGWGNVKEAATACGLPTESWRTWERDGVEPRGLTRIAQKVADATGCDYGWLVDGPRLAGRRQNASAGEGPTAWYSRVGGTDTRRASRPADNRPGGHPDGATTPAFTRTARLPRPGGTARP